MTIYSSTFSAVGVSSTLKVANGKTFKYSLSCGTWGTSRVVLEKRVGASGWKEVGPVYSANRTMSEISDQGPGEYRLRCSAYDSNAITYSLAEVDPKAFNIFQNAALSAKVGATSGWVVGAAADTALVTIPASQTASTLVVPVTGLRVGDVINSFWAVGQVESAGNTASITVQLRKMTSAAADVSDASIDTTGAVSFTADAIMGKSNVYKDIVSSESVGEDESFYFLITATTAASTDIALQGLGLNISRAIA